MSYSFSFRLLTGSYSLSRLPANTSPPVWVFQSAFYTLSKSEQELSIICETQYVPSGIQTDQGWSLLRIEGTLDLSLTGITAKFSAPLAKAGVNLCVVATYDTDYLLIKTDKLNIATKALQAEGIGVEL